jgi:hypothetical protein
MNLDVSIILIIRVVKATYFSNEVFF